MTPGFEPRLDLPIWLAVVDNALLENVSEPANSVLEVVNRSAKIRAGFTDARLL